MSNKNFYSDPKLHPKLLRCESLTADAFAPFGEIISMDNASAELINEGHTEKFADLAQIDTAEDGGRTAIHLFRSQPLTLPLLIEEMEKHPLSSQAFMPLHNRPFLVIVAPPGERVDSATVRAFITDGKQGINLRRGTWHHYQVSLVQESDHLVIDRVGPGRNLEEQQLDPVLLIQSLA